MPRRNQVAMKYMKLISLIVVITVLVFCSFRFFPKPRKSLEAYRLHSAQATKSELPSGVYLHHEHQTGVSGSTWCGYFYLPRQQYSQQNLEIVFHWFAARHPDETSEDILLWVYTNAEIMEMEMNGANIEIAPEFVHSLKKKYGDQYLGASYKRTSLINGSNEIIEDYHYSPEANYNFYENGYHVNLRGCDDFLPESVGEWKREQGNIKLRLECVISRGHPAKYYYQLYCEKFTKATAVFSMYNPSSEINPEQNVQFLSDGKASFYFGWKFAVTIDAGKIWNVWSADRKLKDFQAGEYNLIKSAKIEKDGTGTMELSRQEENPNLIKKLYTKDFGKNWEPELSKIK